MKNRRLMIVIAMTMVLFLARVPLGLAQKHYKDLTFPPLHQLKLPHVEQVRLPNGMRLFLVEDHTLPIVNLSARIGVGSIHEPADKVGLAEMMGTVMRTGGSEKWPGDKVDEFLESIAASIEISIGEDSGFASMSALKENVGDVLAVFADILRHPTFPKNKIELKKVEMRSAIARRNDDPTQVAFREFMKLIYGADSPYARHPEYATVDSITREDLIAFHRKFIHPDNIMIGIWGDFNTKQMIKQIKKVFGDWKPARFKRPAPPPINYEYRYTVNFIRKSDVNQSTILIGHIGGRMDNPDYFALQVMNDILGGGFASRLFRHVRSDQGLAYAVFGRYGANFDHPGVFYVGCMTKSETTVKATRALLTEIRKMISEPVTDEELRLAKESFLNSFVFNFDTRGEIINRMMTYKYYGYPLDFLERTRDAIQKVTKEDVMRVARKYLKPDTVQILVVGNDKKFDEPLSVLGKVREIDITIPEPGEKAVGKVTEQAVKAGQAWLVKMAQAVGGETALRAVKTIHSKGKAVISTPRGDMQMDVQSYVRIPDDWRMEMTMPMGQIVFIIRGDRAWMVTPGGSREAPASMQKELVSEKWRNPVFLAAHVNDPGVKVAYQGKQTENGRTLHVIRIQPPKAKPLTVYLDDETHRPVKIVYRGQGMGGAPVEEEERWEDWRDVSGIKVPFKVTVFQNGKQSQQITFELFEVNVKVKEDLFKTPG